MASIDIRDVVESIINRKSRYYSVDLDEFRIIYDKVAAELSEKFVFIFQIENKIHVIFYEAPDVHIIINENFFIKPENISFVDRSRAYIDLIEKKISFLSFTKNELTNKYNFLMIIIIGLFLPLQLKEKDPEIVKTIMDTMLIFISIFFSIFLSFIPIESGKKMSKVSLYYEYMTNSYYILIFALIGFIFTVISLVFLKFNFLISVISCSFSLILIILSIKAIINYNLKHLKFANYNEIIEREFKNKSDEFFERFKRKH